MYSKLANNPAFEDELGLLLNALRSEAFRFILVSQNHPSVFSILKNALIESLGKSRKIHEFSFENKTPSDIRNAVIRLNKGIMLVKDVEYLFREENNSLCTYFNQRRDFFAGHDIAFLFFMEPGTFPRMVKKIPDWWSLRSLELEFSITPDLVREISGTWNQGESSPFANWTKKERIAEIERLERLISDADPQNSNLLGWLHADLGKVFFYEDRWEKAMENYLKCLSLFQNTGNHQDESKALNEISKIYQFKGDYETALRYLEQALAIQQSIGDRLGEGVTLNNLAVTAYEKGYFDRALGYLEQALAITKAIGDRQGEGRSLNNISQIHQVKGDYDRALGYLEQSLEIRQAIGDLEGEGATFNNISQIYSAKGDYDRTFSYLEKALDIQQTISDTKGEGTTLNNIGQVYSAKGDYDRSLNFLEKALAIQQAISDKSGMATTLHNMGALWFEHKNDVVQAVYLLYRAFRIFEEIGSPNTQASASYLQTIIGQTGVEQFQEIISQIEGNDQ